MAVKKRRFNQFYLLFVVILISIITMAIYYHSKYLQLLTTNSSYSTYITSNNLIINLPLLIFQIGFNKCGTTSLFRLFQNNNISGLHWYHGYLYKKMFKRYLNHEPVLTDFINNYTYYTYYSDFGTYIYNEIFQTNNEYEAKLFINKPDIGTTWYQILCNDYPEQEYNKFFILNIRNVNYLFLFIFLFVSIYKVR